jgi:hypothetical protein
VLPQLCINKTTITMQTQNLPEVFRAKAIVVNELVFITKDDIRLYGFFEHNGQFYPTEYQLNRRNLQVMLSFNGPKGVQLLWTIETLFDYPHPAPYRIDLIGLFGTAQCFEGCDMEMERPWMENADGTLMPVTDCSFFFINEVLPLA